jgi:tagatose-1,6-bisphosphate aldolase non-catalytic subunit AgaZ/GatZ
MNVFDRLVEGALADHEQAKQVPKILQEDFELWQKDYTWDALHGLRYGQSFCNRFSISDNLLYYTGWPIDQIDAYIKRTYIA